MTYAVSDEGLLLAIGQKQRQLTLSIGKLSLYFAQQIVEFSLGHEDLLHMGILLALHSASIEASLHLEPVGHYTREPEDPGIRAQRLVVNLAAPRSFIFTLLRIDGEKVAAQPK